MVTGFQHTEIETIPNDWEIKSIREIAEINQNGSKSIPDEFVYIDLESVTEGKLVKRNVIKKEKAPSRAQRIIFIDDILFQTVRPYQKNNLHFKEKGNFVASTGYAVLRSKIDAGYLYAQLHTDKFVNSVIDLCTGTSYPAINPNVLATIKIPIPPTKAEQTAIATALNDADALIQQLEQLLTKKRNIKTGAMQELLKPKEGWEENSLTAYVDYIHGKAHEKNIDENGKYIVVNSKFISSDGKVVKNSNENFCPARKGDILTVLSDLPNGKALAKCFYVDKDKKYAVNQRICIWRSKGTFPKFLFYTLNRNKYFIGLDDGISQTHILNHHIEKCRIHVPKDEDEQVRIAQILSDMDNEIQELEKQLEKYKMLKQGMMQSLLTGKIRLV